MKKESLKNIKKYIVFKITQETFGLNNVNLRFDRKGKGAGLKKKQQPRWIPSADYNRNVENVVN